MRKLNMLSILFLFSLALSAQVKEDTVSPVPEPRSFISNHQIVNEVKTISYKAVAS